MRISDWSSDVCASDLFGTLDRKEAALPPAPTLPAPVLLRWQESWGDGMCAAAAAALAEPPPIDLTLKDPSATAEMAVRLGGASLASGHVRVPFGGRVEELRSAAGRVGTGCFSTLRYRWAT